MIQQTRQTAYKVWIGDLLRGKFFPSGGELDPSYLQVDNRNIYRVNIVATVIETFTKEDRSFVTALIDDGSGQIVVRAFKDDVRLLQDIQPGTTINIIGKPREYQNEIYLIPEIIRSITDHNWELFRKAELLTTYGIYDHKKKQQTAQEATNTEHVVAVAIEGKREHHGSEFKRSVAHIISIAGDGAINPDQIAAAMNESSEKIKSTIEELIKEGTIYQDRPGYYKLV